MAREAALILEALDRHLRGPGTVRLLGGGAMTLAYGMTRTTEDVDLLQDDAEVQVLIEQAEFGEALTRANAELEPRGLYLTHIWGPEQLTLPREWRGRCRRVELPELRKLTVEALGPEDLVVSKLVRGDDGDFEDIAWLLERHVDPELLRRALSTVEVPSLFADIFPVGRAKVEALLDQRIRGH